MIHEFEIFQTICAIQDGGIPSNRLRCFQCCCRRISELFRAHQGIDLAKQTD